MQATPHAAGTFCWRELATPDPAEAGAFYSALMNWKVLPCPDAPNGGIQVINGDRKVAIMRQPRADLGERNAAPSWLSFIAVPSVAESLERTELLGGQVLLSGGTCPDGGDMAIIADPAGARVALCTAHEDDVCEDPPLAPGGCYWTELATRDAQRAAVFYAQLLGWRSRVVLQCGAPSTLFMVEDTPVAGLLQLQGVPPIPPSSWAVCFAVTSAEETAAHAQNLGANVATPPKEVAGVGLTADIIDPQGGHFSIMEPVAEE
jgi:uncharacterized protein